MTTDPPDITRANLENYGTPWSRAEYARDTGLRENEERLIVSHFPRPPARVLDLGCGAGRTTIGLAQLGYAPVGIDLAEALLESARSRFPTLDFRHMDATQLRFPEGSFEAALFSFNGLDCIHPLASRAACLAEVFRVLRPGGTFLLSSHNAVGAAFSGGFFYARGYRNAFRFALAQRGNPHRRSWYLRYEDGGGVQHLYSAPPGATVAQLKGAGFEVLAVEGVNGKSSKWQVFWHEKHVNFVARKPS